MYRSYSVIERKTGRCMVVANSAAEAVTIVSTADESSVRIEDPSGAVLSVTVLAEIAQQGSGDSPASSNTTQHRYSVWEIVPRSGARRRLHVTPDRERSLWLAQSLSDGKEDIARYEVTDEKGLIVFPTTLA